MVMPLHVGVLALQGAFREHVATVTALGAVAHEIRQRKDLDIPMDALILPGGESTTMGKLLVQGGMLEILRQRIQDGLPVLGSCAGLILLCQEIENSDQPRLGVLDATVRRNAFGRQVDSFETELQLPEISDAPIPAVFIRAPVITRIGSGVRILASVNDQAVAVRQDNILAISFHPELTSDTHLHSYFLSESFQKVR